VEVLYFLVPLAALLSGLIVAALVWAVRSGQFEDLEGPAHRILMEDDSAGAAEPAATPARDATAGGGGPGEPAREAPPS
jgi:cbb3-type cytochrome oxidase maturation protein